jgi:hypothetical protein
MARFRFVVAGLVGCAAAVLVAYSGTGPVRAEDKKPEPDKAAVERAREQVKMLDDLYKTAVVQMTKLYVGQQGEIPAAVVAMEVFDVMRKKGYHNARLVDVIGKPKRKENVAKTDWEKRAVEQVKAGKAYYEEVGERDGKPVFRAVTAVPAVMKECAACHRVKEGDQLGAIVYELPIK